MSVASREAYKELRKDGKDLTLKQSIHTYIENNNACTNRGIIKGLKIPHKTATARISELLDDGKITILYTIDKISHYGVITNPETQERLSNLRNQDKLDRAANKLVDHLVGTPLEFQMKHIQAFLHQYNKAS